MRGRQRSMLGGLAALCLAVQAKGETISGLPVPEGWKVDASASGDLTGDGVTDYAVVIRQKDPKQVIHNDRLGASELDTNPRRLLIFAGEAGGFRQIAAADRMIPPAADLESPCQVDPLEDGGIAIKSGMLSVKLQYWQSCGSWAVVSKTFKFRREGGRFRLIGFDHTEFMRNSGQGDEVSVNFLTSRKAAAPFAIDGSVRRRLTWSRIRPLKIHLDSIDLEACVAIDQTTNLC